MRWERRRKIVIVWINLRGFHSSSFFNLIRRYYEGELRALATTFEVSFHSHFLHISGIWNILRIENESENIENFWGVLKDNKSKLSKRLMRLKFYILFFLSSLRLSHLNFMEKMKMMKKKSNRKCDVKKISLVG